MSPGSRTSTDLSKLPRLEEFLVEDSTNGRKAEDRLRRSK